MRRTRSDRTSRPASGIETRKREHLERVANAQEPAGRDGTWLDCVHLVHQALPESAFEDLDIRTEFAGRAFDAPLFVTGMTGGTPEAREINQGLARVATRLGIGFGLGSQRAMIEDPALGETYEVRREAPTVFLAGNIGGVQLARLRLEQIRDALRRVGADALCVHLNPAQELAQPEGDRDFRGVARAIACAVEGLGLPVIVKEVGCGLSREAGVALRDLGVRFVDVAGAGGTSWVEIEMDRAGLRGDPEWEALRGWGVPTAASLLEMDGLGFEVIASGGIRNGVQAARAIALGATLVGVAAPALRAWFHGGEVAVEDRLRRLLHGLKVAMLLTGCRNVADLRDAPRVLMGPLAEWARARCGDSSVRG